MSVGNFHNQADPKRDDINIKFSKFQDEADGPKGVPTVISFDTILGRIGKKLQLII